MDNGECLAMYVAPCTLEEATYQHERATWQLVLGTFQQLELAKGVFINYMSSNGVVLKRIEQKFRLS